MLCFKVHSHLLLRAYLLGIKRKLPPPACPCTLINAILALYFKVKVKQIRPVIHGYLKWFKATSVFILRLLF